MNEKAGSPHPPGLSLDDVFYIVFRHKWKILLMSVLGFAAALTFRALQPPLYESEARLYVRYVLETKAPSQLTDNDGRIKSPDTRGNAIVNTELEILTSRDLALQVATAVGPERLLGEGHGNRPNDAATVVLKGIKAEVAKESSVIRVLFQHNDPEVVQRVLVQLINSYFKKHAEIHGGGAFDDFLTRETDQLRTRLVQTEEELRKAKEKTGVISLTESRNAATAQISRIQQQLLDAEAELAEHRAAVKELTAATRNAASTPANEATPALNFSPPPAEVLSEYRRTCTQLETLSRLEQERLLTYTASNSLVKQITEQIAATEQRKKQMEIDNPGLLATKPADGSPRGAEVATGNRLDLVAETVRGSSLEAKVKVLTQQLDDIRKRATVVSEAEPSLTELQRRRDQEETHYRKFTENLAQSQLDERLGAGKVSNISTIEEPTPPRKAPSKRLQIAAALFLGCIASGFGLAFLIELYLDQSVRRPVEVESRLGLPLFLSIPLMARNGSGGELNGSRRLLLAEKGEGPKGGAGGAPGQKTGTELVHPVTARSLQPYYETLRDRLITYFEMKNLTHKPKLVAVTGCAEGSGVSTTAAGLAASLSETGEGNVLLVNMNLQNGAVHHFHKGELRCGLEEVLASDKRKQALVQENLYVVSEVEQGEHLPSVLPKRFKQLVPRLKASDFDYIIFDMPPVSQISLTPRLARFMDTVLLVVEGEKTGRDAMKKASAILSETNPNVGIVFNKETRYIPEWLKQHI